ncbi:MAG: DUF2203 domain-containing protein [Chloroflexi bacterium]|nr:DUF2203 domain-containing protein [Chloroflexota bacterium]
MRLFTVDEANRLLPAVADLVRSMQAQGAELAQKQRAYADAQQYTSSNGHSVEEKLAAARAELERLSEAVNARIAQLNDLGCVVKDVAMGLLDFPGLREGEVVNLCWRLGEPEVAFWHPMNTGFADRRPIRADD